MSSRRHTVDQRFAQILEEDFGIDACLILQALEGEPQKAAIAILEWDIRTEDPAYALICWSRRHRKGAHCPGQRRRGCGQPQECQRGGHGRRGEDRDDRRRASDTPRTVGPGRGFSWGYGVGRETVLAGLERMGA